MSGHLRVLLIGAILGGLVVYAQVTTGTISGVVQDPSGGVSPGVAITVRNLDTGAARTVTTDPRGSYTAPNLSLGNYEVQAQQSGFQTEIRNGITLTVGREVVINFALKVGQISDKITVTSEALLVESTTATLSSLVDERTIRDLPLNGRSYDQLALGQPGVVSMGAGQAAPAFDFGTGTRFSVTGSRAYANSFLLDGTNINDHANGTPGGAAGTNLGVDGIREVKIITNLSTAEYGGSSGGVISAVTRSGTNTVHGSAFEFLRNSALDSPGYFDGGVVPPFRRNQFGGALGGPIKKDKTFFFGAYEGLRQGLGTTGTAIVPTALAKQGILPTSTVRVNSIVQPFVNLYPDPNGRDFGDGTAEYVSSPTITTNEDYFMIRVDHQISDKMRVFGRYSLDKDTQVIPNFGGLPIFSEHDVARRQYSTFQISNILRPALVNSLRLSYNRTYQLFDDLPNKPLGPEFSFIPGQSMGTIMLGSTTGGSNALNPLGVDNGAPRDYKYNLFQWGDDLTLNKGRHTFKVGADLRRLQDNAITAASPRGVYTFDNFVSLLEAIPSADVGFAAPKLGSSSYRGFRETMAGVYAQDDFKMTQRLALSLGLRYEVMSDPTEVNGKMANLLNPLDPTITVLRDHFFTVGKKDFEPRAGLAWQLNQRGTTVLRAGFGMFHDHILPYSYSAFGSIEPPFYVLQTASSPSFPDGYKQLTQQSPPRAFAFPPSNKEPVKNSYSFSLQHQVMKDTLFEVAYLGSESHHLQTVGEQNTPVRTYVNGQPTFPAKGNVQNLRVNQNFGSVAASTFSADANYNALQVTLKRRSSRGLQYQAFYTYAKSLDTKSTIAGGESQQETATQLDPLNRRRDYGRSAFDAKRNFVFNTTYPFPFRFQQKAVGMILGGWTVNGVGTFRAGEPFTERVGFNRSRTGDRFPPDRPNLNPGFSNDPTHGITLGCAGVAPGQRLGTPDLYYDPCAFSLPAAGTFGNLGRNTLTGPGLSDVDASVEKVFQPRERISMQFRVEVFNMFDRANFNIPVSGAFAGTDRVGSAGRINRTITSPGARVIQFGLKVIF
jgi:carboxypeptidase family protein/TonB-dependent receptor-like protein